LFTSTKGGNNSTTVNGDCPGANDIDIIGSQHDTNKKTLCSWTVTDINIFYLFFLYILNFINPKGDTMSEYPTYTHEEIEPVRYTKSEYNLFTRYAKKDGRYIEVCPLLHGPDKTAYHPYYKWFLMTDPRDWVKTETKQDINPDVPCKRALYDSGCDDAGYDQPDEWDINEDKGITSTKMLVSMHYRTISDMTKTVPDHLGRNVIAAIQEKREERITWQYDPKTWIKYLPNAPVDLIIHFTRALRKLNFDRTQALRLIHGQGFVQTESKTCTHKRPDGTEYEFTSPSKGRSIAGLAHPQMPKEILIERMQEIIELSKIEDMDDLYAKERADAEQSNMEYYHASDEVAFYDKDGIFKEVQYIQKNLEWDITAPLTEDENGDEIITDYAVCLEDGTDQTNDAVTHTLRPFQHPNDSLPWHMIETVMNMSALDIEEFQKTLFNKFDYSYTDKQKSALWTWIDHRRNQIGMPPTKGFKKYYEVQNYQWQLKPQHNNYAYLRKCMKNRALRNQATLKVIQRANEIDQWYEESQLQKAA
jgi:hypothetical protein